MKRPLFLAIAAGTFLRLLVLLTAWMRRGSEAFLVPDSISYLDLAQSLAQGRGFRNAFGLTELFRTPGYPFLLAIGSMFGHPIALALAMQLLLSAAIVAMTFLLARQVLQDGRWALGCAFVAAIEPTMLAWSLKVMPETLLTATLLAFTHAAILAWETGERRWVVLAAVALCASAYGKPIAYPLVILVCLVSLPRMRVAMPFIALCVLLLAPWHLRNARHGYFGFSTLFARAAYLSAGGSILAQREHRSYEDVRAEMLRRADVRGPRGDPSRYGREGAALIASDPFGYAKTHVRGVLRTMFDPGATEYLRFFALYEQGGRAKIAGAGVWATARAYPLAFWSSAVLAIVLAPLVLLPFVAAIRARTFAFFFTAAIAASLLILGGGVPGYSRFRVPAVPLLIVTSALAWQQWQRREPRSARLNSR